MLLILLFKPQPWHIQTIEQWLNWEIMKDLKNMFLIIFGNHLPCFNKVSKLDFVSL